MDLGLTGKSAVVAGASSGLGLAIATALAAEGANVSVCGRDPDKVAAARAEVDRAGAGQAAGQVVDVRDHDAVRGWIDGAARDFGGLHIVVANAGGPPPGLATEHDFDAYREAVELNLLASIGMVQAGLPHLRAAGWGRVLFLTSISVRQPIPTLALSSTARPGLWGYMKSLVVDLGDAGITVNMLAPGSHRTARLEQTAGQGGSGGVGRSVEEGLAETARSIPLGRVGRPEELGAAAAFLASERASFITGVVLPVDGGVTRGL